MAVSFTPMSTGQKICLCIPIIAHFPYRSMPTIGSSKMKISAVVLGVLQVFSKTEKDLPQDVQNVLNSDRTLRESIVRECRIIFGCGLVNSLLGVTISAVAFVAFQGIIATAIAVFFGVGAIAGGLISCRMIYKTTEYLDSRQAAAPNPQASVPA